MSTSNTGTARSAIVIGGGIAGLSAAFDLHRAGWRVDVHEASGLWGGKVQSSPVGDRLVDAGPDTFLARATAGYQMCQDLGLEGELTSPVAPVPAYIARAGRLYPLPTGSMLGVPTDLDALAANGLISAEGVERAKVDLSADATPLVDGDISIGALCRARLGDEITDWLVDPLIGGINASDIDLLSLRAGAPILAAAYDLGPSLIKSLGEMMPSTGPTLGSAKPAQPVFYGLPGGIARIVDGIIEALTAGGAGLHLNSPIGSLADAMARADAVVIATPTAVAAQLLNPVSPTAAAELAEISYSSVAQAVVEIPRSGVERELDASGIMFPRGEGRLITACTWLSSKWAHYHRPDSVLLRLSSGRYGDERNAALTDDELVDALLADLRSVEAVTAEPIARRVKRWTPAFPQYAPGHLARVERILGAVAADAPAVRLVGAAYRGIGVPACIDDGRSAAASLVDALG